MVAIVVGNQKTVTELDDDDAEFVQSLGLLWSLNYYGYLTRGQNKKFAEACPWYVSESPVVLLHRLIVKVTDRLIFVDHKDGDKLNNQKHNLRICSNTENCRNSKSSSGASRYKGVTPYRYREGWVAQIKVNRLHVYLGIHPTEEIAARAYDKAARLNFGEFALTNFKD